MTKQQPSRPLLHLVGLKEDLKEREENGEYKFPPSVKPGATNCEVITLDVLLIHYSFRPYMFGALLTGSSTCSQTDYIQGMACAMQIGANRYLECSAKTAEGMDTLFEEAGREACRRAVLRTRGTASGMRRFF